MILLKGCVKKMSAIDLDKIEKSIMNELKDFQICTVKRINHLFTEENQDKILVSDEVGLGKTLIARGTIVKFAKWRKEQGDDLVKVVYVCSNATIADQNLEKLRVSDEVYVDGGTNSRLSMQHLNIFKQENDEKIKEGFIQLIPLTPSTSFDIGKRKGKYEERALIFSVLMKINKFKEYYDVLYDLLKQNKKLKVWELKVNEYLEEIDECNEGSNGEYLKYMEESIFKEKYESFFNDLIDCCGKGKFNDEKSNEFIVGLRKIFADISLDKLNPDLIIMDEFQRFNELLNHPNKETEATKLADKFFKSANVKILMLSATPFKLYSTPDEINSNNPDENYKEFLNIINFLNKDNFENFKDIWSDWYYHVLEYNDDDISVLSVKSNVENELYKNICRTERITEKKLEDLFEDINLNRHLNVMEEDIESYIQFQELLDKTIGKKVPLDYIKSSPYLMSFMKCKYKLKEKLGEYFKKNQIEFDKLEKDTFWIKRRDIKNYNEIKYNNARLIELLEHVLKDGVEKLLWVPPSLPYYDSNDIFKEMHNLTKTLIFSSWEMVPPMISSIISYEIERRTIAKLKSEADYFADERYYSQRLTFKYEKGPKQMPLLNFIYPSKFLTEIFDPVDCLNKRMSLNDLEKQIISEIDDRLAEFDELEDQDDKEDKNWYFLAPLLLDGSCSKDYCEQWFEQINTLIEEEENEGLKQHFYYFESFFKKFVKENKYENNSILSSNNLGKKPSDLSKFLCDVALASPAICINRAYRNELHEDDFKELNNLIFEFAKSFINYFNSPMATAVVDSYDESDRTYLRKVLRYAKNGNIQAVIDEYVHILLDGLHMDTIGKIKIINRKITDSMHLHNAAYEIDTCENFISKIRNEDYDQMNVTTHYAVSFIGGDDGEKENRKKSVLSSFNSPFWPFILTSTSIGQEGLDFHQYCRRIVHWNLPANAIDFEQREGRINRFKSLAIRQNIAKRYCNICFKHTVWSELFEAALDEAKSPNCSELIPYWGLNYKSDMIKIERLIPLYPYSRDISKFNRLQHILRNYRLTLGQPNQDYLMDEYIDKIDEKDKKKYYINLSPFYKNLKKGQTKLDMFKD